MLAAEVVERTRPVALAGEQRLPVLPPLETLLPDGLRRGTTVSVQGASGATSLALALAAGPSAAGSWVAAVGLPSLGLLAAAELGVSLERLAMVAAPAEAKTLRSDGASASSPGGDGCGAQPHRISDGWATVVATLVDAFDVVLLGRGARLRSSDGRRLAARTRERGAVVIALGGALEPDTRLRVVDAQWTVDGHLTSRRVTVEADGRRAAARPRRASLWLPGPDGVAVAPAVCAVIGPQKANSAPHKREAS